MCLALSKGFCLVQCSRFLLCFFVFHLLLAIIIVLFHVYEYVIFRYTSCVSGDYGGQKGVSHPLKVESQPVVRHVWVLGRKLGSLEGQQVL